MRINMVAAAALVLAACATGEPLAPLELADAGGEHAPIRTDAATYVLRPYLSGYGTDIGIRFENRSQSRMYAVNCQQQLAPVLQKKLHGEWVTWWSPVLLGCLSAPIVLQPGEVLERRLQVWGALPGTNWAPQWQSAELDGTYRVVLSSLVYNYTDQGQRFGDPVPLSLRVSNEFTLVTER